MIRNDKVNYQRDAVVSLKERLSLVLSSEEYDAEMKSSPEARKAYELPDGMVVHLGSERVR